jgi:hypothetical protein
MTKRSDDKCNCGELLSQLRQTIQTIESSSRDPAEELRALGKAMIAIADVLEGKPVSEARSVLRAVQELM